MVRYYLQLVSSESKQTTWEHVSEYIFLNRKKCPKVGSENPEESPRYTDNHILIDDRGFYDVKLQNLDTVEMKVALRILGIKPDDSFTLNGYVKKPDFITIVSRGKPLLHEVASGNTYKVTKKPVEG